MLYGCEGRIGMLHMFPYGQRDDPVEDAQFLVSPKADVVQPKIQALSE